MYSISMFLLVLLFTYGEPVCIGRSFIFLGGGEGAYIIYVYLTV